MHLALYPCLSSPTDFSEEPYCFVPPYFQWLLDANDKIACAVFLTSSGLTGFFVGQYRSPFDALQTAERRHAKVLDAQSEFICRFKADGTLTYVNGAFCRYFGKTEESLVGHVWQPLAFHDDVPLIQAILAQLSPEHPVVTIENRVLAATAEMLSLGVADIHPAEQLPYVIQEFERFAGGEWRQLDDIRILRKDGTERLVSIVPASMETTGQPLLAGLFRDVTERHRQEMALREADRRKDEFLATLSHELRNPLAPIKIGVGVLRRAQGDPKTVARVLDIFDASLSHLIRLVDDLLDISRITTGKIHLQIAAVDLAAVIQRAVELSLPFINESGHTLHLNLPETSIRLNADLTRLGQAFANLLNNAAKFTPRGGDINVTAEQRKDTVVVTVRDNGIGIPAAILTRIFDMFAQGDQSLEKQYGGLGIGLSLVKELITLHGGTVEARSEGDGKGSEFIVCLPCEPMRLAKTEHQDDQDPESTRPDLRRILVCDDNVLVTTTLKMHFASLGHQIAIARDGLEAVKLAETFHPDLILMDIGMPNLNGYEACQEIRRQPWGRNLFIAALTGWGSDPDRQRADEAGFDHYLLKPVDPIDLDRLIEALPDKHAG
jgi:signal transduction histidine kinase/ActR/RegA family two-component response regulator